MPTAIGGSVNLVMKQAPERFGCSAASAAATTSSSDSYGQNNVEPDDRHALRGRRSAIASVSGSDGTNARQPGHGSGLHDRQSRRFRSRVHRSTAGARGFTSAFDFRPKASARLHGAACTTATSTTGEAAALAPARRQPPSSSASCAIGRTSSGSASLSFDGQHTAGNAEIDYRVLGALFGSASIR